MAIAFDTSSESHTGTAGSTNEASFSWSHPGSASAEGVLVFVFNLDSSTSITSSVTYGGVDMTAVSGGAAADTAGEIGRCAAWYLDDPPTGTQTVQVNRTNNTNTMYAVAITVTAAAGKLTEVYEPGIVLVQEDGTVAVQAVTDGSPGSNSTRFAGGMFGHQTMPIAGTGSTLIQSIDIGAQGAVVVRETTAGQGSRNVGMSSGTSDDRAIVHLAVRENGNRPTPSSDTRDLRITGQDSLAETRDIRITAPTPQRAVIT